MSNQILLSLSGACLLQPLPRKGTQLELLDMPRFVAEELELRGLNVPVAMIRGQPAARLEQLRDQADRAQCPCLVLYQDDQFDFDRAPEVATTALKNLARAAKLLGCAELAIRVGYSAERVGPISTAMKQALGEIAQFEVNLLVRPSISPCDDPGLLMDLIRKIGGFHISAMPSFAHAHATGDPVATLRKLAPYSAAIEVSIQGFNKQGDHLDWSLDEYVGTLVTLGYLNKFSLDWRGTTNWVLGIQKARERIMQVMEREDQVA